LSATRSHEEDTAVHYDPIENARPIIVGMVLVGGVLLTGCEQEVVTAGAAGASIDVEYIAPDRFDDAAADPILVYPAKFVCGEATIGSRFTPGSYRTVINVLNLSQFALSVRWRFTNFQHAFAGATAQLAPNGSLVMDCDFIVRQFASVTNVDDVLEGFVVIEDPEETKGARVSVVYTALHKQLHDLPDLKPVRTADRFCARDDDGRLLVTIENRGERPAQSSVTRVQFEGSSALNLTTPELDPGQSAILEPVPIPSGEGFHPLTISADFQTSVRESNELNNIARGGCLIIN
jgi:hypothetical protein